MVEGPEIQKEIQNLQNLSKICEQKIASIPGLKCEPMRAGFYLWVDVRGALPMKQNGKVLESSQELAQALLELKYVVVTPGKVLEPLDIGDSVFQETKLFWKRHFLGLGIFSQIE